LERARLQGGSWDLDSLHAAHAGVQNKRCRCNWTLGLGLGDETKTLAGSTKRSLQGLAASKPVRPNMFPANGGEGAGANEGSGDAVAGGVSHYQP